MTDLVDQDCTVEQITHFYSRMIKTPKEKRSVSWLKTNLEALEQLWSEFHERHRIISRNSDDKEDEYFKNDVYGSTQTEYIQVKTNILTTLSPGRNQSSLQADKDHADVALVSPPMHRPCWNL